MMSRKIVSTTASRFFFALLILLALGFHATAEDYTFSCWVNGWRKNANDSRPDVFAIQTSRYGFTLDVADFDQAKLGSIKGVDGYPDALADKATLQNGLSDAKLGIEIDVDGRRYQARTCKAGVQKTGKPLSSVLLWESGRFVQHYEFLELHLVDSVGKRLACEASLDLVAWDDSLTFNLKVAGGLDCQRSVLRLNLDSELGTWHEESVIEGTWVRDTQKVVSMTCDFRSSRDSDVQRENAEPSITVESVSGQAFPVRFDAQKNCQVALVRDLKRSFKSGYTDIRDYDDFEITVTRPGELDKVPFLLDMRGPANVTGVCVILCDENGKPTGIPVQLSKNWHYEPTGSYVMAYTQLPIQKSATYLLRFIYGFYGTLPSASHAQLSLVGYSDRGGNGRWDQYAIGCWGETICFDMDMSLVDVAITDVRMLMSRAGANGRKWGWTDAGWGGDWLNLQTESQAKLFPSQLKTAYVAHGPCLTDIRHEGYYGANQEVDFTAQIQIARSDDISRTHQRLTYTFTQDVSAQKVWLFQLGGSHDYQTPQIVYGNADGLIETHDAQEKSMRDDVFLNPIEIAGPAPHWLTFQGAKSISKKESPSAFTIANGYRSLIIRRYHAVVDGTPYRNPTFRSLVHRGDPTNLNIELLPPAGIMQFRKGDRIELDLELITLPRQADDYYGPNETFRQHLAKFPNSWRTTIREAIGNRLGVEVIGGEEVQNFPLVIKTQQPEVIVRIQGGVGFIPVRFEGLPSANGFRLEQIVDGKRIPLDQSIHGNDFWQTDYHAATDTYQLSFNLPTDESGASQWVLSTDTL